MSKVISAMITTSEDATMLPRINLTVVGIVFSVIIATKSRMLTVKTGMRKKRMVSKEKYEKSAEGSSKGMKLSLLLLLVILYLKPSVKSHTQNASTL